jgi:hypothetical protein
MTEPDLDALRRLRQPFPADQIGKLPKKTKTGGTVYLDFVGHGYLTARLLDVDPCWNWEPFALDADGLPALDPDGGLWIRLTVAGVTRIGYGHADGDRGPNAVKEAIGDALRNAAMRFGAALALWCGGDLDAPPDPAEVAAAEARADLRGWCQRNGIDLQVVAEAYIAEHKRPLGTATAEQVRAFKAQLEAPPPERTLLMFAPAPAAPADAEPAAEPADAEPAAEPADADLAMQYQGDAGD